MQSIENFKKTTGVHITTNHSGKMAGMQSLSTSCTNNPYCQAYSKDPNSICSHCYAQRQMKVYGKKMSDCFERNGEVLNNKILNKSELPLLNVAYFRFESFGDIQSETQVVNYFNICKANKDTKFALWTKNPFIIQRVLDNGTTKPRNLQIVLSSRYINAIDVDESVFIKYPFIDKIFTVYDKEFTKENNIDINCGARNCLQCHKCYVKSKNRFINELLK